MTFISKKSYFEIKDLGGLVCGGWGLGIGSKVSLPPYPLIPQQIHNYEFAAPLPLCPLPPLANSYIYMNLRLILFDHI
uniref:Uncharacterized protein n=1 Tax=Pleurastrum terricola TaxID=34116 RepID=A6YGD6_PLETE|nr:hypothetical protein LeteCp081 [Pleurastrum terricola]ABO69365.1 hypothetical protein [Pleurastrum terricola]